jgi:hypothetical protein
MILIGTPSYDGTVTLAYMRSVLEALDVLAAAGVRAGFNTPSHESLIPRARNFIANEFLRQSEYTHLLFIDSDIGFPPEAPLRYLRAGKDVACGVYPVKHLPLERLRRQPPELSDAQAEAASLGYTVKFKPGQRVGEDGFIPVEYAPTGFMMIRRAALERMAKAHPELVYRNSFVNSDDEERVNYAFFDTAIDPVTRDYLPEDYAFCKRWAALGGEIHADVTSRFVHVGSRAYSGDFPEFLKRLDD